VLDLDLLLLAAANISNEPHQAGVAFRPRLQRPGAQAARKLRRQHRDAYFLDDVPDSVDIVFVLFVHGQSTWGGGPLVPGPKISWIQFDLVGGIGAAKGRHGSMKRARSSRHALTHTLDNMRGM
jgi:hypothetical protein